MPCIVDKGREDNHARAKYNSVRNFIQKNCP